MATRSLTQKFEACRQARSSVRRQNKARYGDDSKQSLLTDDPVHIIDMPPALPPRWVDLVEEIHQDMSSIRDKMAQLKKAQDARLKVNFSGNRERENRDLKLLTDTIGMLIKKSETGIKKVALIDNDDQLAVNEKVVRLNVMRALAHALQEISRAFRTLQKDFFHGIAEQDAVGTVFDAGKKKSSASPSADLDDGSMSTAAFLADGFDEEQKQTLEWMERHGDARRQVIAEIATSVTELSEMFNELNSLVIEQGTILDRIDHNIENTMFSTQKAVQELGVAEKYSRKAIKMKCILCLVLFITIEIFILLWKEGAFSSRN